MFQVNNRKLIWKLTLRSLKVNQTRNKVAVIAIALTTILFSSIFSIGGTILNSFQEESFRQSGGFDHVAIKDVTKEQIEEIKKDPLIDFSGKRLFLGFCEEGGFEKIQSEISYMDKNCAKTYYSVPEVGTLPKEGTKEIAMDTKALEILGVEPELGREITLTYSVGIEDTITDTFTLCGWWEFDSASVASMIIVPESYCHEILGQYSLETENAWSMGIMFHNSFDIEGKLEKLLENHGYQNTDPKADNYLATGINWGYITTQMGSGENGFTVAGIAVLLLVVVVSGYLIIYNIFQISVQKDIQYYGLLKTIGTTKKQIEKMIRIQAMLFSVIGIPIGLIIGFFLGNALVPVIMEQMNQKKVVVSTHPLIFIGAALFSLFTVILSCEKPGRIAGKVLPMEALRFTQVEIKKKVSKGGDSSARILKMAFANLGRNKKKTVTVVLSLTLSAVLFYLVFSFSKGFDMDKFTQKFYVSDFIVAENNYFKYEEIDGVEEEVIWELESMEGITESGRIYIGASAGGWFSEEDLQSYWNYEDREMEMTVSGREADENGLYPESINIYGMDEFPLANVEVLEGDITKVADRDQHYIIAVVEADDYGKPIEDTCQVEVGEQIKVSYYDRILRYDASTGGEINENTKAEDIRWEYENPKDITYTVCAKVIIPYPMTSRSFGNMFFVLDSDTYRKDTGSDFVMSYMFNTTEESNEDIQKFLESYTEEYKTDYDFESKQKYQEEFSSFRNMFLLVGSILAFIIGLIGVVNFFNSILTGIHSRKKEFAMLQSVGMTGGQLRRMLIYEGTFYTILSVVLAILISGILQLFVMEALSGVLWFFTAKMTILPLLIILPIYMLLGILIPVFCYQKLKKSSIVERLRDSFS